MEDKRLEWIIEHWPEFDERARSSVYNMARVNLEIAESRHEQRRAELKIV